MYYHKKTKRNQKTYLLNKEKMDKSKSDHMKEKYNIQKNIQYHNL
jgi:hypothetical protein